MDSTSAHFAIIEFQEEKKKWKDTLRGIKLSKDKEDVWELGPETNLAASAHGASIVSASTNYDIACDEKSSLLSLDASQRKSFCFWISANFF